MFYPVPRADRGDVTIALAVIAVMATLVVVWVLIR
jgi:hypothetical protein